jgi:hypothetical protein
MKILISFLLLTLSFSNKRKTDDDDVKITKKNDDMTNSNLECSHFRDCFNCSSFSYKKCGWDGNECFLISNSAQKINLSEIENSCYNFYDEEYKTSRCGKLSYSFEGKKIKSVSLPKISNKISSFASLRNKFIKSNLVWFVNFSYFRFQNIFSFE